jgi:hypothetical protein
VNTPRHWTSSSFFAESNSTTRRLVLALISFAAETMWSFAIPFGAGWDSGGYMAVARWYSRLPPNLWNIYQYYSPGYPVMLALSGLFYADSFEGIKLVQFVIGVLSPLVFYGIVYPWGKRIAFSATLAFMLSTAPFYFSRDVVTDHTNLFLLLVSTLFFVRFWVTRRYAYLVVCGLSFFVTYSVRPISMALPIVYAIALFLAFRGDRVRNWRQSLTPPAVLLASFAVLFLSASLVYSHFLNDGFRLGITKNLGARVIFNNAYTGAASYFAPWGSIGWHLPFGWEGPSNTPARLSAAEPELTCEDTCNRPTKVDGASLVPVIRPENGPAATALFEEMRAVEASVPGWSDSPLGQKYGTEDAFVSDLIERPVSINFYYLWWELDRLGTTRTEQLLQAAPTEAFLRNPAIVEY